MRKSEFHKYQYAKNDSVGTGNNNDWASHARRENFRVSQTCRLLCGIHAAEGLLTFSPDRFEIHVNHHFEPETVEGSGCCRIVVFH